MLCVLAGCGLTEFKIISSYCYILDSSTVIHYIYMVQFLLSLFGRVPSHWSSVMNNSRVMECVSFKYKFVLFDTVVVLVAKRILFSLEDTCMRSNQSNATVIYTYNRSYMLCKCIHVHIWRFICMCRLFVCVQMLYCSQCSVNVDLFIQMFTVIL